jgi:hypothetical protein
MYGICFRSFLIDGLTNYIKNSYKLSKNFKMMSLDEMKHPAIHQKHQKIKLLLISHQHIVVGALQA